MKIFLSSDAQEKASQFLALSIPAFLAVFVSIGVCEPVIHWYQARQDDIAFKQQEISHIEAMWLGLPELRRQVADSQTRASDGKIFLTGDSDAIAGADLQLRIETLARHSNASLTSTSMLQAKSVNGLRQITANVDLTATWQNLIGLLNAIDLAHPQMIVSGLNITGAAAPGPQQDIPLQISFTVAAFRAS